MRNYGFGNSREDGCRVGNGYSGPEIEKRVEYCAQLLVMVTGIDLNPPRRSLFSKKMLIRSLRMR